ncbi:MAG: 2-oxo acid dehydrogenase subunit E2, partial [Actinomycetota bacterium]|nr:2-oxo acid dehydrogenase subunit E2 [Actinomycetota bacterium]
MAELRQFKLPDVGEGLTEADIVRWHVQAGDTVKVNQIIVEIETAKAVVELPSPHAGVVSSLLVAEGETVDVGTPIIAIDTSGDGPAPADVPPLQTSTSADLVPPPPAEAAEDAEAAGKHQAVLVGYGVKLGSTARRQRKP